MGSNPGHFVYIQPTGKPEYVQRRGIDAARNFNEASDPVLWSNDAGIGGMVCCVPPLIERDQWLSECVTRSLALHPDLDTSLVRYTTIL